MVKDLDFKKMYEWPPSAKGVVFFVVAFFVFYLGYFIDISSYRSGVKSARQQEEDLKRQVVSMYTNQVRVTQDIAQLPKMQMLLSQWQEKIITKGDMPELLDQILRTGVKNQVKISDFNPLPEVEEEGYYRTTVNMHLSGTYDQIASFISDIANLSNLVGIGDFTLGNAVDDPSSGDNIYNGLNSSDILSAQLNIEIYRK